MSIADLDFGKTNSKLLVFDEAGRTLFSRRTRPFWRIVDGIRILDDGVLMHWAFDPLAAMKAEMRGSRPPSAVAPARRTSIARED